MGLSYAADQNFFIKRSAKEQADVESKLADGRARAAPAGGISLTPCMCKQSGGFHAPRWCPKPTKLNTRSAPVNASGHLHP